MKGFYPMRKTVLILFVAFSYNAFGATGIDFNPPVSGLESKVVTVYPSPGAVQFEVYPTNEMETANEITGPWMEVGRRVVNLDENEEVQFFRVDGGKSVPGFQRIPCRLHVPDSYNGRTALPLIVRLHYLTLMAQPERDALSRVIEEGLGLAHLVDSEQFLYLTPAALHHQGFRGNGFYWNATDQCCQNYERTSRLFLDDLAHLRSAIEWVISNYNVDSERIMMFGTGSGGAMANEFACTNSDLVAGSISWGSLYWIDPEECSPAFPIHHLDIYSLTDDEHPYRGGQSWYGFSKITGNRTNFSSRPVETEFSYWGERFGCGSLGQWERSVFKSNPEASRPDTSVRAFLDCDSDAVLEQWVVQRAGHYLNLGDGNSSELDDRIVQWAKDHPKIR